MTDYLSRDEQVFIGRQRELEACATALAAARAGHGQLLLLAGEPGIGKTRLASECAAKARAEGFRVLWGRAWEGDGAPAFWPWIQIVRGYLREADPNTLIADLGRAGAEIARVMPELEGLLPAESRVATGSSLGLQPEQERFRFFDGLTLFLKAAGRRQPLMLVLDDLQWADTPSLLLWQFLIQELDDGHIIDLLPQGVTYRLQGVLRKENLLDPLATGTFVITATAASYTPWGDNVTVRGGSGEVPVSVPFSEVTAPGTTEIEVANAPEGVTPATFDTDDSGDFPPIYVSISTDAAFEPPLTVCIHYPDDVPDAEANAVRLWHSTEGAYREEVVGRVVDTVAHTICATVGSLSPFALAQTRPPRSGFVPPDKTIAKCESSLAKAGARLAHAIAKCHTRAASDALAGKTPTEEACETEARAKFDEKVATLLGCPACALSAASDVRDRTEGTMNTLSSAIYCDGSVPLGSDSFALVPTNAISAACAKKVVKAVGKRANALAVCHKRAAKAALKGKFFDADGCEAEAAAKFMATALDGCPACLIEGLRAIGVQLESSIDHDNGLAYCDGAIPFP